MLISGGSYRDWPRASQGEFQEAVGTNQKKLLRPACRAERLLKLSSFRAAQQSTGALPLSTPLQRGRTVEVGVPAECRFEESWRFRRARAASRSGATPEST